MKSTKNGCLARILHYLVVGSQKRRNRDALRWPNFGKTMENAVPNSTDTINALLISSSSKRTKLLTETMGRLGLTGEIYPIQPSSNAVERVRRCGRFKYAPPHDFVLFDFAEADEASLTAVSEVAFAPNQKRIPVILLTSAATECLLQPDGQLAAGFDMFAPTTLVSFLQRMKLHSHQRFLRALAVLSELGPVLVRLPMTFLPQPVEPERESRDDSPEPQAA